MKKLLTKRISQILMVVGILLLIYSLFWWQQTFGFRIDFLKCFAVSGGICKVSAVSNLLGGSGYNPIVFWAALVCLVIGIGLKKSG